MKNTKKLITERKRDFKMFFFISHIFGCGWRVYFQCSPVSWLFIRSPSPYLYIFLASLLFNVFFFIRNFRMAYIHKRHHYSKWYTEMQCSEERILRFGTVITHSETNQLFYRKYFCGMLSEWQKITSSQ